MMEAQNTPESEPFVCKDCKRYGLYSETHDVCEANYINNFRQTDCNCDNIGHGWNVTSVDVRPDTEIDTVSDEDYQEYCDVNNALPEPTLQKLDERFSDVRHQDPDRIDLIAARSIKKHNWKTVRETEVIYHYDGKIYNSKSAISVIKEETEKQIRECNKADKSEVIDKIKSLTYTDISDFDSDPDVLTLENGVFNIRTGELTPHTPTNLSKVLIPCSFIEGVTDISETKFWKYLTSTCTVDGELDENTFDDILELMASCFLKCKTDEKSFILLGDGDNGKSVLLLLLNSMLGKGNVSNIALQDLVSNPFAAARLDGKLANIYTDLKSTALKNEEKIKNLSSGEAMHVENKYQQGFDMVTYATLIFSCNQFPKVYDQSDGFFRRWIIIKFNRKFALGDPDRDEKLKDKLVGDQTEKDLVFSYLMMYSEKLLRTGKFRYPLGHKEIRKLWNANADQLNNFIDNSIIDKEGTNKTKRETYKFYEQYCFDNGIVPLGKGQFGKVFGEEFDDVKLTRWYWLDIEFKVPKQETLGEKTQW